MFRSRVGTRQAEFIERANEVCQLPEPTDKTYWFELKPGVQNPSDSEFFDATYGAFFPTLEEIRASIPAARIAMAALVNKFRSRIQTTPRE
ncbi:hypothetical protein Slin15195_G084420 [Septoria linicola]|uniref:Uncharacterized protein n=1 Tax=Septoria linicola TaxID=215465 RepID=A0A9Q9B002_9PEZI|nr:hypothetical protein Slin15195_G084420 [Septoria linicola]